MSFYFLENITNLGKRCPRSKACGFKFGELRSSRPWFLNSESVKSMGLNFQACMYKNVKQAVREPLDIAFTGGSTNIEVKIRTMTNSFLHVDPLLEWPNSSCSFTSGEELMRQRDNNNITNKNTSIIFTTLM